MIIMVTHKTAPLPTTDKEDAIILVGDAVFRNDLKDIVATGSSMFVLQSSIDQGYPIPDSIEVTTLNLEQFAELTEQHEQTISV